MIWLMVPTYMVEGRAILVFQNKWFSCLATDMKLCCSSVFVAGNSTRKDGWIQELFLGWDWQGQGQGCRVWISCSNIFWWRGNPTRYESRYPLLHSFSNKFHYLRKNCYAIILGLYISKSLFYISFHRKKHETEHLCMHFFFISLLLSSGLVKVSFPCLVNW